MFKRYDNTALSFFKADDIKQSLFVCKWYVYLTVSINVCETQCTNFKTVKPWTPPFMSGKMLKLRERMECR